MSRIAPTLSRDAELLQSLAEAYGEYRREVESFSEPSAIEQLASAERRLYAAAASLLQASDAFDQRAA